MTPKITPPPKAMSDNFFNNKKMGCPLIGSLETSDILYNILEPSRNFWDSREPSRNFWDSLEPSRTFKNFLLDPRKKNPNSFYSPKLIYEFSLNPTPRKKQVFFLAIEVMTMNTFRF